MNKKQETDFVLRHYRADRLNTQEAFRKFCARTGIRKPHRALLPWAIAASFVVLIAAGAALLLHQPVTTLTAGATVQQFRLADSTRVTLSPHSTLSYKGTDARHVQMTGKIYFEVKHRNDAPFEIDSKMGHVRVLGTKFEVDEHVSRTEVFVTAGKVLFTAKDEKEGVLLTQGMRAVLFKNGTRPTRVSDDNINHVSWATHQFHFDNTPLDEVLKALNHHYGSHLAATQSDKRLTGDFEAGNLHEIVDIIRKTMGVDIEDHTKPVGKQMSSNLDTN